MEDILKKAEDVEIIVNNKAFSVKFIGKGKSSELYFEPVAGTTVEESIIEERCKVQFLLEDKIYSFEGKCYFLPSTKKFVITEPINLSIDKRAVIRIDIEDPLKCKVIDKGWIGENVMEGEIVDISIAGAKIRVVDGKLEKGKKYRIETTFKTRIKHYPFWSSFIVRNISEAKGTVFYGVLFVDMDVENKKNLNKYIEYITSSEKKMDLDEINVEDLLKGFDEKG